MSEPLRQARRAHASQPSRSTAERLDAELARAGDGPYLPDVSWRLSQFHAMTANLFLSADVFMQGDGALVAFSAGLGIRLSPDASGQITLTLGGQRRTLDLGAQPPNAWHTVDAGRVRFGVEGGVTTGVRQGPDTIL